MSESTKNGEVIVASQEIAETAETKKVLRNADARKISSLLHTKEKKEGKLARLKSEKEAFKQILERGYSIVPLDGEGHKTKHQTLDSIDRKSINNKIKGLDLEIMITSGELEDVESALKVLLQKNINANTDKFKKFRFAKKTVRVTKTFTNIIKEANKNGGHDKLVLLKSNYKNQNTTIPEDSLLEFFSKLPKSAKRSLENDSELKKAVMDEISKVINKL